MTDTEPLPIPDEALRLFGGKLRMGYVATARPDGHLSVVPVAVMVHEGQVRISSPAPTRKIGNLRQNPHIAVCVPDPEDGRRYLMVRGTAELTEDPEREFLDWMARTHMGLAEFPRETPEIPRIVITVRAERFVMGGTFEDH
jgi:PPOX class probable F420-dependent enzyme